MPRYCECPGLPVPYRDDICGRCFCPIEPEPDYCPTCEGEGRDLESLADFGRPAAEWIPCSDCDGTGLAQNAVASREDDAK